MPSRFLFDANFLTIIDKKLTYKPSNYVEKYVLILGIIYFIILSVKI